MNKEFGPEISTAETEKDPLEKFEKVANGFSAYSERKITNKRENDKESVIFQQDMIEYLLSICEDEEDVESFWDAYEKNVSAYIGKIDGGENKRKAWTYFNNLKRSIIGSSAVVRFFEGQGFQMKLPSVEEDMAKKCDLKFDKEEITLAVQVKSGHLQDLSRKKTEKIVSELILTDAKKLEGKDEKDFRILSGYCSSLSSSKNNEVYLPVFVNIPVTQESRYGMRRHIDIIKLVDESGKISKTLQKFMEDRWKKAKETFDVDLDIDKDI